MFAIKASVLAVCAGVTLNGCSSVPLTLAGAVVSGAVRSAADDHARKTRDTGRDALPEPASADALYQIARAYQAQGQHDVAISTYSDLIARYPTFAEAHNGLGMSYSVQGRYADAIRAFQGAIAVAPQRAYLYNNLGYAQLLRNANAEAVAAFEQAVRLEPAYSRALNNLQLARQKAKPLSTGEHAAAVKPAPAAVSETSAAKWTAVHNGRDDGLKLVSVAPNVFELRSSVSPVAAPTEIVVKPTVAQHVLPQPVKPFRLEVSNGNGTRGVARRVADDLVRRLGIARPVLSDQAAKPTTEVQYRNGYESQAARIAALLPMPASIVRSSSLNRDIQIRVVVGQDLPGATPAGDTRISGVNEPKKSLAHPMTGANARVSHTAMRIGSPVALE